MAVALPKALPNMKAFLNTKALPKTQALPKELSKELPQALPKEFPNTKALPKTQAMPKTQALPKELSKELQQRPKASPKSLAFGSNRRSLTFPQHWFIRFDRRRRGSRRCHHRSNGDA